MSEKGFFKAAKSLSVQTKIHATSALLKKIDSMVYLYDPSWVGSTARSDVDTLPFVFLEVIKEEVVQNMQVSKKRMILFEPDIPTGVVQKEYRPSVVNVVADNVINEPAIHKLEALLPSYVVGKFFSDALATSNIIGSIPADTTHASGERTWIEYLRLTAVFLNIGTVAINRIIDLVRRISGNSADYNRLSLLRMARSRAILKYKTWNSWYTKSVVISGLTITKVGNEDDYYRVNLELQEVPILHVGRLNAVGITARKQDAFSVAVSRSVKAVFDATIGKFER
jgi:hypothetical protein